MNTKLFLSFLFTVLVNYSYSQTATEYYKRGVAKGELQDYRGAIADFTAAIKINPKDFDAYQSRGFAKGELQDYRGAIADHTRAIEINPTFAAAYYARGLAKISVGDKDGGCLDLSKAGELGYKGTIDAYATIRLLCH